MISTGFRTIMSSWWAKEGSPQPEDVPVLHTLLEEHWKPQSQHLAVRLCVGSDP